MSVYDPLHDLPALQARLQGNADILVVCYCAAWCDTCGQYQRDFAQLADKYPQHVFVWVDIEEQPELLGDEDVENFPTILLQTEERNLFFGTQLPYISHLEKLLERLDDLASINASSEPPLLRPLLMEPA